MAAIKPAEMSNEELLKKEKQIKVVMYMLAGFSVVLLAAGIFLSIKKGFSALVVIPISMLSIIVLNANLLKEIRKEMKVRGIRNSTRN